MSILRFPPRPFRRFPRLHISHSLPGFLDNGIVYPRERRRAQFCGNWSSSRCKPSPDPMLPAGRKPTRPKHHGRRPHHNTTITPLSKHVGRGITQQINTKAGSLTPFEQQTSTKENIPEVLVSSKKMDCDIVTEVGTDGGRQLSGRRRGDQVAVTAIRAFPLITSTPALLLRLHSETFLFNICYLTFFLPCTIFCSVFPACLIYYPE